MLRKHYQAIARAIYKRREMMANFQGWAIREAHYTELTNDIADVLQAENPAFDRARFVEACETGTTKGMRKAPNGERE